MTCLVQRPRQVMKLLAVSMTDEIPNSELSPVEPLRCRSIYIEHPAEISISLDVGWTQALSVRALMIELQQGHGSGLPAA
jgi:hypothetical protein